MSSHEHSPDGQDTTKTEQRSKVQ